MKIEIFLLLSTIFLIGLLLIILLLTPSTNTQKNLYHSREDLNKIKHQIESEEKEF